MPRWKQNYDGSLYYDPNDSGPDQGQPPVQNAPQPGAFQGGPMPAPQGGPDYARPMDPSQLQPAPWDGSLYHPIGDGVNILPMPRGPGAKGEQIVPVGPTPMYPGGTPGIGMGMGRSIADLLAGIPGGYQPGGGGVLGKLGGAFGGLFKGGPESNPYAGGPAGAAGTIAGGPSKWGGAMPTSLKALAMFGRK